MCISYWSFRVGTVALGPSAHYDTRLGEQLVHFDFRFGGLGLVLGPLGVQG